MAHLLREARPPRRGGSGSGRSRYQYDTPNTWLRKAIDVRDMIEVPEGQLIPWGYIEYLPDRFAPGPKLTNTPTIPQPR
jgi:hypothetical protein